MSLSQPKPQRLNSDEARALLALDEQFAETRRGSTTAIVLAACNARNAVEQDRVMVALAGLRRRHLVNLRVDRWMPTPEGIEAARQQRAANPGLKRKPEPHRPAPDPDPQPADAASERQSAACSACGSREGQYHAPECPFVDAFTAGRIQGDGSGQALPAIEYPATVERLAPPMSVELLHRCAAMQLALLTQVQRAHARGEPGADRELAWLIETGRQLVAAGGAHGQA